MLSVGALKTLRLPSMRLMHSQGCEKTGEWGAVEKLVICFLGIVSKYRK
jgi:hypothetical protein